MKKILIIAVTLVSLIPSLAMAQAPSRESLMTMLKASGAVDMLAPMVNTMTKHTEKQLQKKLTNLPAEAQSILMEELQASVNDIIMEVLSYQIDFYAQNMTQDDIDQLIEIYSSPVWKKNIQVGQQFIHEKYGAMLKKRVPEMQKEMIIRILTRLKDEGFLDEKEAKL